MKENINSFEIIHINIERLKVASLQTRVRGKVADFDF